MQSNYYNAMAHRPDVERLAAKSHRLERERDKWRAAAEQWRQAAEEWERIARKLK